MIIYKGMYTNSHAQSQWLNFALKIPIFLIIMIVLKVPIILKIMPAYCTQLGEI